MPRARGEENAPYLLNLHGSSKHFNSAEFARRALDAELARTTPRDAAEAEVAPNRRFAFDERGAHRETRGAVPAMDPISVSLRSLWREKPPVRPPPRPSARPSPPGRRSRRRTPAREKRTAGSAPLVVPGQWAHWELKKMRLSKPSFWEELYLPGSGAW